ncbi:PilW family protein [Aquabacterium sp. A7-Y]|uniref:PilW family protein n=1 Tax=Aquabacterium sp. A7-Y TaxID=1349605 RepID=UPI00223DDBE7|nr:PilW family protein [Aquabacterium sp. A7-Y]MCW7539433.1 PilW family protein [Aquabacterium sp. A7-Y]
MQYRPQPRRRTCAGRRRGQTGVTLVELMVSITLSLLISGFLVTLYVNASRARGELDKTSRQIENGRYALDLLREDIEMAGFFGPLVQGSGIEYAFSSPDPCLTAVTALGFSTSPWTLPSGVQGIAPSDTLSCLPNRKADTAAIALRRVDPVRLGLAAANIGPGKPHFQTSFCYADTARFVFSDDPAAFTLRRAFDGTDCTGTNFVQRYVQRIYYISSCGRCSPSDGVPTLKRVELVNGAWQLRSLADGLDDLHFVYGFDQPAGGTTPEGTADVFSATLGTTTPSDRWSNVVAVRVFLLARTAEPTPGYTDPAGTEYDMGDSSVGPFSDGYKRRAYSTQVRIQNVAGVREKP